MTDSVLVDGSNRPSYWTTTDIVAKEPLPANTSVHCSEQGLSQASQQTRLAQYTATRYSNPVRMEVFIRLRCRGPHSDTTTSTVATGHPWGITAKHLVAPGGASTPGMLCVNLISCDWRARWRSPNERWRPPRETVRQRLMMERQSPHITTGTAESVRELPARFLADDVAGVVKTSMGR
ncbi:hypothetical protein BaRGS_00017100 [Batillaria attramentaria]|uniref:Uncharacterized protein n=1 Tax=Batillaria attramentaria TaxID=370345 RepID=A0ABD0KX25_9CAEN